MAYRVFLVEDEPIIAGGIARKLEQLGYVVAGSAAAGEAAVRQVDQNPPDLVLMDVKLEGRLDGIDAAAEIRKRHELPIVFLTAYADEATITRAKQQGPFGYIVKPFTDRELSGAIEVALHRHALDQALRTREERYRMLSEVLADYAFCIRVATDPENDRLEWSVGSGEVVFGVPLESMRGIEDLFYLIHPDDLAPLRTFWQSLRQGKGGMIEFRAVPGAGQTRTIKMDAKVRRAAADRPALIYGAFQNVSELRPAGERLEQREFEFGQIVQTVRQGIWVADADGVCIYANPAICDMSGYTREELVGRAGLAGILALVQDQPEETGRTESRDPASYETELIRKDGERRAVLVTPRTIRGQDRDVRGAFYLVVDISRQRKVMDALERGQRKLRGVFHLSPAPSLLVDAASNAVLDANEAFTRLTGFTAEEIAEAGAFGLGEYRSLDDLNQMISLLKERTARTSTIRLRTRGGATQPFTVEVTDVVVDDEELLVLTLSPPRE